MLRPRDLSRLLASLALLAPAAPARAQSVQLAPFAGYQFGGTVQSDAFQAAYSVDAAPHFGGTLDVRIHEGWHVEAYYSRSSTELSSNTIGAPRFGLKVERLLLGIEEEKGEGRSKYFGAFLLGATRLQPELAGFETKDRFTIGLTLGLKPFFTKNFGLRLEGNAFWTMAESDGGLYCSGGACLFTFSGTGIWQVAVSGGVILAF